MKKTFLCGLIIATTLVSCSSVKVTNSTDAEVIPVRMVGTQPTQPPLPVPPTAPANRKIIEYTVVNAVGYVELTEAVMKKMKEEPQKHWQPFGGVSFWGGGAAAQAMVIYE